MRIESPDPTYVVDAYDFQLINGNHIEVMVDLRYDTYDEFEEYHYFVFGEKPNSFGGTTPAEDMKIFHAHIVSVVHSKKLVTAPNAEEVEDLVALYEGHQKKKTEYIN